MADQLPKRPDSHQLAQKSEAFLSQVFDDWIVKEESRDYGIDFVVEVVNPDNTVSGHRFGVQLKATSRQRNVKKQTVKVSTLNYMQQQSFPVMLLQWVDGSNEAWYKWAHLVDPVEGMTQRSKTLDLTNMVDLDRHGLDEVFREILSFRAQGKFAENLPVSILGRYSRGLPPLVWRLARISIGHL